MITTIIAAALSCATFFAAHSAAGWGAGWSTVCALVAFVAVQASVGLRLRKAVMADMQRVQNIMQDGQKRLQAKMQRWQIRPPGSVQAAQKEILEDTRVFVAEAAKAADRIMRFRLWIPAIARQAATAKVQLFWMAKDFKKVDEAMPKAIMADPSLFAMKMARMQMLGRPLEEIGKVYAKSASRFRRYNANVLPAACWTWILMKHDKADEAFKALGAALEHSDDQTLKHNREALMNNRPAQFTNSGLADKWYALFLEEPRIRMQRQRQVFR